MVPLGKEWRDVHMNKLQPLQKYMGQPAPPGFGVLYAVVKRFGDEKAYIGKTSSAEEGARNRMYGPMGHARGRKDSESAIHNALKAHGKRNFIMFVFKLVPSEDLNEAEKKAIREFNTLSEGQGGNGYNIMEGGDGGRQPDEVLERMHQTMATPEWKTRHSKIMTALQKKPEVKAAHRAAMLKSNGSLKRRKEVSEASDRSWADPKRRAIQSAKALLQRKNEKIAQIAKARSTFLPYEPVAAMRIKGKYYERRDGMIGRCGPSGHLRPVCPVVPGKEE